MIVLKKYILSLLIVVSAHNVRGESINDNDSSGVIMDKITKQYGDIKGIDKLTMKFDETIFISTQSYDFRNPTPIVKSRTTDLDFTNRYYYEDDISTWPGGFVFHYRDFQNAKQSLQYDVNGVVNGKRVREFDLNNFDVIKKRTDNLIDFLAVRNFLKNHSMTDKFSVVFDAMNASVTLKYLGKKQAKQYVFSTMPIRLLSVVDTENQKTWHYTKHMSSEGLSFATQIQLNDMKGRDKLYTIKYIKPINMIAKSKLMTPMNYGPVIPHKTPDNSALKSQNIAPNIYLVTNALASRNILFKVIGNNITVFGAPLRDSFSNEVIAVIKKQFPMKKIDQVYVSHAHHDHIGGLRAYAKLGATILADAYTIEAIKHYKRFSDSIKDFTFTPIKHKQLVDGVRFYVPKNSHSKGQSFVHFEHEQLIYEGDFLEIPFDNTIATNMSDVEKTFIEFVRKENIMFKRIVGHHRNNNISPMVMNAYYSKNTL